MKKSKIIGAILAGVGITIAALLVLIIVAVFLLERGPSQSAKVIFVNSVKETSAMGWLANLFLSDEEVQQIVESSQMKTLDEGQETDTNLINIDEETVTEDIEVIDVQGSTYKGKLMIIHDPSKVFCGTIGEFGNFEGMEVQDMVNRYNSLGYNVVGGINGGDFVDNGTNAAATGQPLGLVISEGEIVYSQYGNDYAYEQLCGFTEDNKFVLMQDITANEAIEKGIRDALYCVHNTGPFLIINNEVLVNAVPNTSTYGGGKNPRSAIGQREDGAVLLLVVDGRQGNSLGASFKDLAYAMQEYGAVNAAAMDGGTSTQMVYEGEVLNHPYSPTGPRKCPTSWLVLDPES